MGIFAMTVLAFAGTGFVMSGMEPKNCFMRLSTDVAAASSDSRNCLSSHSSVFSQIALWIFVFLWPNLFLWEREKLRFLLPRIFEWLLFSGEVFHDPFAVHFSFLTRRFVVGVEPPVRSFLKNVLIPL